MPLRCWLAQSTKRLLQRFAFGSILKPPSCRSISRLECIVQHQENGRVRLFDAVRSTNMRLREKGTKLRMHQHHAQMLERPAITNEDLHANDRNAGPDSSASGPSFRTYKRQRFDPNLDAQWAAGRTSGSDGRSAPTHARNQRYRAKVP